MVNPLNVLSNPIGILAIDTLKSRREAPDGLLPEAEGPPAFQYPPGYDRLIPLGDSDFYVTPNDPVDPWDCDAWPGSPYCDGGGPIVDPLEDGYPGAVADLGISPDGCEVCVTVTPSVLWMDGPPYTVCYRFPGPACRPGGEPQGIEVPAEVPGGPTIQRPDTPQAPTGYCRKLWAMHQTCIATGQYTHNCSGWKPGIGGGILQDQPWTYFAARTQIQPVGTLVSAYNHRPFIDRFGAVFSVINWDYERTLYSWYDVPIGQPDPYENSMAPATLVFDSCGAQPIPAPPYRPPRGKNDPMSCNCAEIEDLLRDIHNRLGCEQFPVEVPQSLYGNSDKTTKLQDVPNLWGYWFRQMDALLGQWPIEIEIEDDDPTKEGKQVKKLELPNIAETLAEIFGLAYKIDTTGDLTTEMMLRLIPEVIAIKNSGLTTQDYVKANASYLGYRGNPVAREISYNFDVEQLDSLPGLLKTVKKRIQGWREEDPDTVDGYLKRIMFAAGIIKAAFMLDKDNIGKLLNSVDGIFGDAARNEDDWDEFVRRLEREEDPLNKGAIPRPNARKVDPPGAGEP